MGLGWVGKITASAVLFLATVHSSALAEPPQSELSPPNLAEQSTSCLALLDQLGVSYRSTRAANIKMAVEVTGPLGGVRYDAYKPRDLVLDCSLVYSLALAGRYLRAHGIDRVRYSSAHQKRKIRGTNRWSRHTYGLAIDVHSFAGESVEILRVKDEFERGLGDDLDCIGRPLSPGGAILRAVDCQLRRSTLFRVILDPDFNAGHYNHFHIEASPWSERTDIAQTFQAWLHTQSP